MCAGWRRVAFEVEQTMEDFELINVKCTCTQINICFQGITYYVPYIGKLCDTVIWMHIFYH